MSAAKKAPDGENPPPRAALPKKAKSVKSAPKAGAAPKLSAHVDRVRASVKSVPHDEHPGHDVHPRGHKAGESIRILAHNYQVDDELESGSGVYAMAHWARFLADRGALIVRDRDAISAGFIRGLTHR